MSCLVIVELENGIPNRPSLATISAAAKLNTDIDLLVFDHCIWPAVFSFLLLKRPFVL